MRKSHFRRERVLAGLGVLFAVWGCTAHGPGRLEPSPSGPVLSARSGPVLPAPLEGAGAPTIAPPPERPVRKPDPVMQEVIARDFPGLTACYEHALKTAPYLRGRLLISFFIEQNGETSRVDVAPEHLIPPDDRAWRPLLECLTNRVIQWQFPRHQGAPIEVVLPLELSGASLPEERR